MVSVAYTHRIICDISFIKWLLEQSDKITIFSWLMHIKSSSEQYKRNHNLILSSEIILNKSILHLDEKKIGAIFKIYEDPYFLQNYKDQKTKNLIFTIALTDERPFKCYFLTSPENENDYKENKHYNGITSVEILSGEKARNIIKNFFLAFDLEKQTKR
jgi:hypothetical protein